MNLIVNVFSLVKPRLNDLGTDRLNYYYSTFVLMACSLLITALEFVGHPLQCWSPAHFKKAWEQYAENYCFVYNTYWSKTKEELPTTIEQRIAQQLIYYQWAPFIMAIEAAFFYIPALLWDQLSQSTGINVVKLVEAAQKMESEAAEERSKHVELICKHISSHSRPRAIMERRYFGCKCNKLDQMRRIIFSHGTALRNSYVLTKLIYMANLFAQFYSTNKFLGQNDTYWGWRVAKDLFSGNNWEETGNFPRIAMCDFQVRILGNLQRYSIQCVLVMNMFNEKIFLFLYWWFAIVLIITAIDTYKLVKNIWKLDARIEFIRLFLQSTSQVSLNEKLHENRTASFKELLEDFVANRMNPDIIMVLKMIDGHTSEMVCCELVAKLWNDYLKKIEDGTIILKKDEQETDDSETVAFALPS